MIIFFYGEDTFRSQQKVEEVKQKFLREVDATGNGITSLEASEVSVDDIARLMASGGGFFSSKRLIILKDIFFQKKQWKESFVEFFPEWVRDSSPEANILVVWQRGSVDKRDVLWKAVQTIPYIQEYRPLEGNALSAWVSKEIQSRGYVIDFSAQAMLESFVGSHIWQMHFEIEKLCAFVAADQRTMIMPDDVKQLVEAGFNDDIFGLMDAVSNKQHQQAVGLLHDQWRSGADPLYILSMLIRQFRILALVKHKSDITPTSARVLSQELGLHPFVVEKAIKQSKNFSWRRLIEAYHALVRVDEAVKTTSTKGEDMVSYCIAKVLLSS